MRCPVCGETKCKDEETCEIDFRAEREQDHKDFVADMEEHHIETTIFMMIAKRVGRLADMELEDVDYSKLTKEQCDKLEDETVSRLVDRIRGK